MDADIHFDVLSTSAILNIKITIWRSSNKATERGKSVGNFLLGWLKDTRNRITRKWVYPAFQYILGENGKNKQLPSPPPKINIRAQEIQPNFNKI